MRTLLSLCLLLLVAGSGLAPPSIASMRRDQGNVFVFGAIVLDFDKKIERYAGRDSTLVDCSNEQYFCAYGWLLHVVLPKRCAEFSAGRRWAHAGMTTEVLSSYLSAGAAGVHSFASETVYLLGNPKFRDVVYEYRVGSGVTAIYDGPTLDRLAVAKSGNMRSSDAHGTYHGLLTLDAFARCV